MITRVYNNSNFYTKFRLPSIFSKRYLIKWEPKHSTKLHNHNEEKCYFYLLKGSLEEKQFNIKENKVNTNNFNKIFQIRYIDDKIGKHIVKNLSNNYSYSYHIYK